eukprot:264967_1
MSDDGISDNHETQSPHSPDTNNQSISIVQQVQNSRDRNSKIDITACRVTFTATQPLKNNPNVFKWEATLNHYFYSNNYVQRNQATLAKVSFCFFCKDELLKNEELSCLYDIIDNSDEVVSSILYLESVQVMDTFHGFDYELCLIQRIIDNHARTDDMVVIKHNDSVTHVCEQMGFDPMGQTGYYSQHQAFKNPLM